MALVVLLGIPFTILWWKQADRWADKEHRRFREKPPEPAEKVVVRTDARPPGPASNDGGA